MESLLRDRGAASRIFEILCSKSSHGGSLPPNIAEVFSLPESMEDKVFRSGRPLVSHLESLKVRLGVENIISFAGFDAIDDFSAKCSDLGISHYKMPLDKRNISVENLLYAVGLLEILKGNTLFHCKSGADRCGVVAALLHIKHNPNIDLDLLRKEMKSYGHVQWDQFKYFPDLLRSFQDTYNR